VRVQVPRLAERLEDLPALVQAILSELGPKSAGLSLSPDTLQRIERQPWPGNIRELRNFLERAVTLGDPGVEGAEPAPPGAELSAYPADYRAARERALDAFERDFARHIVSRAEGNVSRAAREAGIGRGYLHRILRKHGLIRDR